MPYYCNNKSCTTYLKEFPVCEIGIEYFTKQEWAVKMDKEKRCPVCNETGKHKTPSINYIDAPHIAKFGSLSNENKKTIINKRASDALKKENFAEVKNAKRQKIIKQYQDARKQS